MGIFTLPLILRAKENRLNREVIRSRLVLKVPVPAVWGMGRSKAVRVSISSHQIRAKTSLSGFLLCLGFFVLFSARDPRVVVICKRLDFKLLLKYLYGASQFASESQVLKCLKYPLSCLIFLYCDDDDGSDGGDFGAEGMASSSPKHEGLSLISRASVEMSGMATHACTLSAGEAASGRSLELAGQVASLMVIFRLSQKKVDSLPEGS